MGFFTADTVLFIIGLFEIIGMILIAMSALIYILSICCVRTIRHSIDGFTINFSLAALFFSTFYLAYYGLTFRDDYYTVIATQGCNWLYFLSPCSNCTVVFSLGAVSINRLCMIVFHTKRIFKTKLWMFICITGAWILAIFLPLCNLIYERSVSLSNMSIDQSFNYLFSYVSVEVFPIGTISIHL